MQKITSTQQVPASVTGSDQYGNPFDISGYKIAWSADNTAAATVVPPPDTQEVTLRSAGPDVNDSTDVKVVVTAPDNSVFTAMDTLFVEKAVAPPVLATVQINWGTPVPIP